MTRTTVATVVVLQVIGGGRMGEALIGGLLKAGGLRLDGLCGVKPDPVRRDPTERGLPGGGRGG